MIEIGYHENIISINNNDYKLEFAIEEAFALDDKVIVLFDPDCRMESFGQFRNLIALDTLGKTIWTAELPTTTTGDRYYMVVSKFPLVVNSFHSYTCEIDPETGRIKDKIYYK